MRLGHKNRHDAELVTAIDIGTSKVACVIAAMSPGRAPEIVGFAHQRSHGIKSGVVVDLAAAQQVVRAVVAQAEQMAGVRVEVVHVAVNCGRPRSTTFAGHVAVAEGIVGQREIDALSGGALDYARRDDRRLLALERLGYRLDEVPITVPPIGLAGRRLDCDHHAVTVDDGPLRNLALLVESCHLGVAALVPAGYASALAVTTEEDRRLGVTCLDIGAGVTTFSTFLDGHFVFTDLIPVGGQHVTLDIARGLGTPLAHAERIKALYGTLVLSASDEHEIVTYPVTGEEHLGGHQTTRAAIGRIVRRRIEAQMMLVASRISAGSVGRLPVPRIVLSGGASRLLGLSEFVARGLVAVARGGGRRGVHGVAGIATVRVASPALMHGVVDEQIAPAFACLAGVLESVRQQPSRRTLRHAADDVGRLGYVGRVERWLQESF